MNRSLKRCLYLAGLGSLSFILAAAGVPAPAPSMFAARIVKDGNHHCLHLSDAVRAAIAKYDATFTPWTDADYLPDIRAYYQYTDDQAPFAVIGDFNGDRLPDVVLDGKTARSAVVLALLSSRDRYRPVEVERGIVDTTHGNRLKFLRPRVGPGPVDSDFLEQPVVLRHDAFAIEFWEKAATMYVWNGDSFTEFVIAD